MSGAFSTRYASRILSIIVLFGLVSCMGMDPTTPVVGDPKLLYSRIAMEHKAIVLSIHQPYDTVQLRAAAFNLQGDTITSVDHIHFRRMHVLDASVDVDTTGFVTARKETNATYVIVSATVGALTWEDTATIMVRGGTSPQVIQRLEFEPLPPDSSWRWAGLSSAIGYEQWLRLFDANDSVVPRSQAVVHYDLGDRTVTANADAAGKYGSGLSSPRSPFWGVAAMTGETFITASVYAYGRALRDSVLFRRIDPPIRIMAIDRIVPVDGQATHQLIPSDLEVKSGTTIAFLNRWGTYYCPLIILCDNFPDYRKSKRITHVVKDGSRETRYVDSVDLMFDGPGQPESGNVYLNVDLRVVGRMSFTDTASGDILPFGAVVTSNTPVVRADEGIRTRKFVLPGVYRIRSTRYPELNATIRVRE